MSFRETLHIFKGVFGIARSIVRANRRKAYALRHQHAGVRNHAVDHRFNIGTMVADEDDDRAFFARNVVQCVSLAVGGRKPELRRRRIKNDLSSCCRHIAPPCAKYTLTTACHGTVSKACSPVASFWPYVSHFLSTLNRRHLDKRGI